MQMAVLAVLPVAHALHTPAASHTVFASRSTPAVRMGTPVFAPQRRPAPPDVPSSGVPPTADEISLAELLSTCVDATMRGCSEIRRVHERITTCSVETGMCTVDEDEVDYKIEGDPRSALTAADLAAQAAVVDALGQAWPGLCIVDEEDLACDMESTGRVCSSETRRSSTPTAPLQRDLCDFVEAVPPESRAARLEDITVFVDPLDGTREFVEGRVWNVQTLVGIAVNGRAVAGAIGLPFASGSKNSEAAVVYALVGAGRPRVRGGFRAPSTDPAHGGGVPADGERPLLVAGDVEDPALAAAYQATLADGGRNVLLGGTGQKCLAVAEGRADVAIMNFKSSAWDTCAPEALVRAAGGELTDLFGERIVYRRVPPPPATFLNACGVIASSAPFVEKHRAVCEQMRRNPDALARLGEWGLAAAADADADVDTAAVERTLSSRRDALLRGEAARGSTPTMMADDAAPAALAALQEMLGLSDKDWARIAARVPSADAAARAEAGDWASLSALQRRLGLSTADLKAVVMRLPQLLGDDYDADVAPPLARVQERLGLDDAQLKTLVTKVPQILGLEYATAIAPKLDAMMAAEGCADDAALATAVLAKPSALGIEVRGQAKGPKGRAKG